MELVKVNTQYKVTDTFETYTVQGSFTKDVNGEISLNLDVMDEGNSIGNVYYNKPNGSERVNVSYNMIETEFSKFTAYFNTLLSEVLKASI